MVWGDMELPKIDPLTQAWSQYSRETGLRGPEAFQAFRQQYEEAEKVKADAEKNGQVVNQETPLAQLLAEAQKKKAEEMKAQGLNPDGSPIRPEYDSILNPDGTLPDNLKYNPTLIDPSSLEGYNMIKEIANKGIGESDFANILKQQNNMNRENNIDAASRQGAAGTRMAINNLATRGGVSSGARERIAAGGARDLTMAKQGAYRDASTNLLDILKADTARKDNATKQFAEAEGKISFANNDLTNNASQYNLENILKDRAGRNDWNMDTYKSQLDKWGANKQAEATRRSGGGGK